MVNREEGGDNVIRSQRNIKKPPHGWLRLALNLITAASINQRVLLNLRLRLDRGGHVLKLFRKSGHRSETKPSSCIGPKEWVISNTLWQLGLSGKTLCFQSSHFHTFILPWWHLSSADTCDSKPCGSLSSFHKAPTSLPHPLSICCLRVHSRWGGESRAPGGPRLPTGTDGHFYPLVSRSHSNLWITESERPQADPLDLDWAAELLNWTSWQGKA